MSTAPTVTPSAIAFTPSASPDIPEFDVFQQVFALSMLANKVWLNSGSADALQQQLQYDLSAFLVCPPPPLAKADPTKYPPLTPSNDAVAKIGHWNVVWGPAVFQNDDSKEADNAVIVAYCDSVNFIQPDRSIVTNPAYVVAIAATNPRSMFDWADEDFYVKQTVEFNGWDPLTPLPKPNWPPFTPANTPVAAGVPLISMGTAIGVSTLLLLSPPDGAVCPGISLNQFLQGLGRLPPPTIGDGWTLIVTGHSLAGALSPTLALYLEASGIFANTNITTRYVYPTAGATPGNAAFMQTFGNNFPPIVIPPKASAALPSWHHQSWNRLLWNQLDVIPHAWNLWDLAAIPTLYGPLGVETAKAVDSLVVWAAGQSGASWADYVRINNQSLPGKKTKPAIFDLLGFLSEAAFQHMEMYCGTESAPGLIIKRMPQSTITRHPLPGVNGITELEAIGKILEWIIEWLAKHPIGAVSSPDPQ
jgi:hypothetical protein